MACVLDISFQSGEYHAHSSEYDEKSAAVKKGAQTLRKIPKFHLISWGWGWKFCGKAQNFHTRKLGEILIFYAVFLVERLDSVCGNFLETCSVHKVSHDS